MLKLTHTKLQTEDFEGKEKSIFKPTLYVTEQTDLNLINISLINPNFQQTELKELNTFDKRKINLFFSPVEAYLLGGYLTEIAKEYEQFFEFKRDHYSR